MTIKTLGLFGKFVWLLGSLTRQVLGVSAAIRMDHLCMDKCCEITAAFSTKTLLGNVLLFKLF